MTQIIDDQLLGAVLRGEAPPHDSSDVFTTGYFYVRLCQAVLASAANGVLSAPFASLPAGTREQARRAVMQLPEGIGLVSLRDLAPLIGQLRAQHDLNILGMEVLASEIHLEADVYLSAPAPRLEESLRRESCYVEVAR